MIVKQVSVDIEVTDANVDMAEIVKGNLEKRGYVVLGITQEDLSFAYNREVEK